MSRFERDTWTPAFKTIFYSVSGLVRNQHQFCSRRIVLTPKSYFLRPETRHRPHQSSQYDAFPSQARDQCFTRLAKMRRNTVTYWTTADFPNCETCSFIRLKDAKSEKLYFWRFKRSFLNLLDIAKASQRHSIGRSTSLINQIIA